MSLDMDDLGTKASPPLDMLPKATTRASRDTAAMVNWVSTLDQDDQANELCQLNCNPHQFPYWDCLKIGHGQKLTVSR